MLTKALTFTIGAGLGASFGKTFNKIGDTQRKLAIDTANVNKKMAKINILKKYEKQLAHIQKRDKVLNQSTANYRKEQTKLISNIAKTKSELKKLDFSLVKVGSTYKKIKQSKAHF